MTTTQTLDTVESFVAEILKEVDTLSLEERENALENVIKSLEKERRPALSQARKLCANAPTAVPESVEKVFQWAFEHNKEQCQLAVETAIANYQEFSPDKSRIIKAIGQLNQRVDDDLARRLVTVSLVMAGYESWF